jgi:adenylyl- and sulfurtransferase ThiI
MNINLDKHEIGLILDALESYQLDIEHYGNSCTINVNFYPWTETDVENLAKYLNGMLEENND